MLMRHQQVPLNLSPYTAGGTFALYSLLCRHAKIRAFPNYDRTDEELTTYSYSSFHEQSFAAKTKRWLERSAYKKSALLVLVLVGSCMVIGDGILTPAISGTFLHAFLRLFIYLPVFFSSSSRNSYAFGHYSK